ncbi:MAG TPA: carbohydrate ABC transporter permease [Symbiobacteriaceae bacterium]|jgi:multiple sugar transport system permease protein|nr:carbohydrate ABC transporter permease [Symbiobacteriaceae bacterium]
MLKMSRLHKVLLYIAIIAGSFLMATPFLYMLSTALTKFAFTLPYPPRLIPDHPTFENFVRAWTSNNFARYTFNSFIIAVTTVVGVLFFSSMTAYGFARFHFRGKEFLFRFLLFTMMVPGIVAMIPTFLVMRDFHLLDNRFGLVILYTAGGVVGNTFFLRQFFESLPRELEEAVMIDGGNRWHSYWHVILPLSQPALATVGIMTFMGAWDEYYWALVLIKDEAKRTLPIAIRLFQGMHSTNYGLIFAASLIALVPSLLFFIFGQKYFIQGLSQGGVKG